MIGLLCTMLVAPGVYGTSNRTTSLKLLSNGRLSLTLDVRTL
eukprot:SAG11_NODE_16024_length_559_cov_0.695652_1_plen_41_part_01